MAIPKRVMVDSVKQALKKIDEEKLHAKVHGRIYSKMGEVPEGKVAAAKCGICNKILEVRGLSPTLEPPRGEDA